MFYALVLRLKGISKYVSPIWPLLFFTSTSPHISHPCSWYCCRNTAWLSICTIRHTSSHFFVLRLKSNWLIFFNRINKQYFFFSSFLLSLLMTLNSILSCCVNSAVIRKHYISFPKRVFGSKFLLKSPTLFKIIS